MHLANRRQLSDIISVSQGESSEEDSFGCDIEDVSEGSNENSLIYFDENRRNFSDVIFAHIKGKVMLKSMDLADF
jgi:hypothetical protein